MTAYAKNDVTSETIARMENEVKFKVLRFETLEYFQNSLNEEYSNNWTMDSWVTDSSWGIVVVFVQYPPAPETVKDPAAVAKVIPIDGCRFHSSPEPDNGRLESATLFPPIPTCGNRMGKTEYVCALHNNHAGSHMSKDLTTWPSQSLSEEMEAILEPRPWDDAKIAVNQHGKE